MQLSEIITEQRVLLDMPADCSKAVFRQASETLAQITGLSARDIASALTERERLGTTAVGDGISVPHARLAQIDEPVALFARLQQPIDMDAMDDRRVDLFFILLIPEHADNDHLRLLSRIARLMRQSELQEQLRECSTAQEIVMLLTAQEAG